MLAAGTVLACLLVEVGLRLVNIRFDASLYTPDRELGWSLRPNAEGWNTSEGDAYIRINSQGMRDEERSIPKPPGTLRIAVLGDSVTEARQVPLEETFCFRLERQLKHCSEMQGRDVQVLNFGVPGYGTAQELLMLQGRVRKYKPDLVLLNFDFDTDLLANHRLLDYTKPGGRPYFVEKGGSLALDDSFRERPDLQPQAIRRHNRLADVMNHSRLLLLAEAAKTQLPTIRGRNAKKADPGLPDDYIQALMYIPPRIPPALQAWTVTEELLLMVRNEAKSQHAGFLLADFPMAMQLSADRVKQQDFMRKEGIDTLYYPNDRLKYFANKHGIPYLSLLEPMAKYIADHQQRITFAGGHLNPTGHGIAADVLHDYICGHLEELLGQVAVNQSDNTIASAIVR